MLERSWKNPPTPLWAHWVVPGAVLAGEHPGSSDPTAAAERLSSLLDAGVRTFVDLTCPFDGLTDYRELALDLATARGVGRVEYHAHPMRDAYTVGPDDLARTVEAVGAARARGAVYVHCWRGVGRTGRVLGRVLLDDGLPLADVVAALSSLARAGDDSELANLEVAVRLDAMRREAAGL